jgi:glyoxylase I family protein
MACASVVHHVGFTVADLDRSVDFYRTYFELTELGRWRMSGEKLARMADVPGADLTFAMLASADGKVVIELTEYHAPVGRGFDWGSNDVGAPHLCFAVDDLASVVQRLQDGGVAITTPIDEVVDGTPTTILKDPDGIKIELLQPGAGLTAADLLASRRSTAQPLTG